MLTLATLQRLALTVALLTMLSPAAHGTVSSVTVEPPVVAGDAAIDWQWIGLQNETSTPCPKPSGNSWLVEPLFVPALNGGVTSVPAALRAFCVYTHVTPDNVTTADLAALAALKPQQLSALEMDSLSVTPAGELEDAAWVELANHFLGQAGANIQVDPNAPATHLAIVDTAETDSQNAYLNQGNSPHGYTLLNMARALLCNGGDCAADVTSRLAMPFRLQSLGTGNRVVRDLLDGGEFGSVAEAARGLQREVAFWSLLNHDNRLVLNLSLGWDPVFGGGEAMITDMPLAVRAVYRAIVDARCRGALVVAAAGNDPGGPPVSGPLYPAAWERRPAPGLTECGAALGYLPWSSYFPPSTSTYAPLVYAASGVQVDGNPLVNQRAGAGAPLAAFADHAVAEGATPGSPTAVLTGSSVATLVVSSAAALVWHHLPTLRADEVMDHLYQAGDDLGRSPEVSLTTTSASPPPTVRRVSLCTARHRACAVDGPCSVPPSPCGSWDPTPPDLSAALELAVFEDADEVDLSLKTAEQVLPSDCASRSLWLESEESDPADPCPALQYRHLGRSPWRTEPQPGSNFCPSCPLDQASSTLLLETDDSDASAVWYDPVLVLCDDSYTLGVSELAAGDVLTVSGISLGGCTRAWLSATTERGSVSSPLLILEP